MFGNVIKRHLTSQGLDIMHAAAGRQSSNGLVESHWETLVHMPCAYLTEKQMPRRFWFHSIRHTAQMIR